DLPARARQSTERAARADSDRGLRFRLHTFENADDVINTRRRVSGRGATAHWLDRCARHTQSGRLGTLRNSFSLAVPTLSGNRLDVSRRLRSRRHPDAARRRAGRPRHRATDRRLHADAVAGEFAADGDGNVRTGLLRGSNRARVGFSLQQSTSGIFDVTTTSAALTTGVSTLLAAAVSLDGFE